MSAIPITEATKTMITIPTWMLAVMLTLLAMSGIGWCMRVYEKYIRRRG